MPNITPSKKGGTSVDPSDLLAQKKRNIYLAIARQNALKGGNIQASNRQIGYDNGFMELRSKRGLDLYLVQPPAQPSDLLKWTELSVTPFNSGFGNAVAYGNGRWVVVGRDGSSNNKNIIYSTNPAFEWKQSTGTYFNDYNGSAVAYGNGVWVAVGKDSVNAAHIVYSTDPATTWSKPLGVPFGESGIGIAYGNGLWVAVGLQVSGSTINNIIYSSAPSGTWTPSPSQPSNLQGRTGRPISVAYGNGRWVVVGQANVSSKNIIYSTNPALGWTESSGSPFGTGGSGFGIAYGGGFWVAIGLDGSANGKILYSTDSAASWQESSIPSAFSPYGITYDDELWVVVGNDSSNNRKNIIYSRDPRSGWLVAPGTLFGENGNGIAYGGGLWVAVGQGNSITSNILYSADLTN